MSRRRRQLDTLDPFTAAFIITTERVRPSCERCAGAATHWVGLEPTRWFCSPCFTARDAEHERKQGWLYEARERRRQR